MKKIFLFITLLAFSGTLAAQSSISDKTNGLAKSEGYFNFWFDEDKGQLWLEVDKLNTEFLYVNSLTAGIGSNDIGLDRGQLGNTRVVYFERRGAKLMLVQPNYRYRAETDNALERKSVAEAFATSILWGFEIEAEEDGRYLVDATPFLLRDAHGVANTLQRRNQGSFNLDKNRSALYADGIFNFPKNTEFEAILTFQGNNAGAWLRSVAPSADAITVRQHHSFIELPDANYEKRAYDPRAGYFGISYQDYGTPVDEELTKRYISRHRLQKKNPDAEISEAVEPIVYYLDNGTPEPVRSALLDGARWWNEAFEAIGYKDAFRVEVLPEDAHPLDVRYNVIQWIHRSTRGWSYGASVTDPRTGEIIKGHVSLGSLRVRQDYLIAEGLLAPYAEGAADNPEMLEMALARIRQLSAHEVGHTLGIAHNFAASVTGDASVMDYPHPQATLQNGRISLAGAYATGMGAWDKMAIAYGYQDFPEGTDENTALNQILEDAYDSGLKYISDQDARPQGGAHPYAHLWDFGGKDAVSQLTNIMEIRKTALQNFGEHNIKPGTPMAKLEEVLVPVYLFHRYQVEAVVKLIGGLDYSYKLRGDNQALPEIVDAATQQQALAVLLKTLEPATLALPEHILSQIPPRPSGYGFSRETFSGNSGPALDALAIAEMAADLPVSLILNAQRANRLVEYGARQGNLSLQQVVDQLLNASWNARPEKGYHAQVQNVVKMVVLKNLMALAVARDANPVTKAVAYHKLTELSSSLARKNDAVSVYAREQLKRFFEHPEAFEIPAAPSAPPGAPIGMDALLNCY